MYWCGVEHRCGQGTVLSRFDYSSDALGATMSARKHSLPTIEPTRPLYADAIDAVLELACSADSQPSQLSTALQSLTQRLESLRYGALALIAETAATSCGQLSMEANDLREAVVDLCDRLLNAITSEQPFNFNQATPTLMALLFPEASTSVSLPSAVSKDREPNSLLKKGADPLEASLGQEKIDRSERVRPLFQQADKIEVSLTSDSAQGSEFDPVVKLDETSKGTEVCNCSDGQLLQEFLTECLEHQTHAEQQMLVLESDPHDQDSLHGLFRAVHSLKGASGVCDMLSLGQLAHLSESVLVRVRDGQLVLDTNLFKIILLSIDFMGRQLRALQAAKLAGVTLAYPLPPAQLWLALHAAVQTGTCTDSLLRAAQSATEDGSVDSYQPQERRLRKFSHESLRVDSKRLGLLIDLIGELVITEAMVQRELDSRHSISAISVGTRLRKVVREVQQLSLTLKMVPVSSLFQKLNRMVHDLAIKLNKPAELIIDGADTEVDKTLLEGIADPLMHLVRNALDHGIESTNDRIAAGKSAKATIRVAAEHRSGNVHFTISDDGRGLDRVKILNRAIAKGMVASDSSLSPREIDSLVFSPGFSTVDNATELSGRGVGMDVVRRNVESMRGAIQLESRDGVGTTVRLELPLTLSIIDGTVIRVGSRCFIAPTLSVAEQIQANQLSVMQAHAGELIDYRGGVLELLRLGEIVGVEHVVCPEKGQVCLIIETSGRRYGLIVDEILGQQPIVIKSLGEILEDFTYYAGGALLSDGEIAFVLDLAALTRPAAQFTRARSQVLS